ncbi:protein of unknown function (plasmid) [Candidatus Methylocalor cossyra]|uniref:Transposase IS66 central domain-containing protein n=1 Tax=Candidatus Methylocalor cossyra TaxID=3108543 RepID=A0ABM9NMV4_9GAMM
MLVYLQDGRIHLDTNPVERSLRGVAVGRRNYLFAGSPRGLAVLADRALQAQRRRTLRLSEGRADPNRRLVRWGC